MVLRKYFLFKDLNINNGYLYTFILIYVKFLSNPSFQRLELNRIYLYYLKDKNSDYRKNIAIFELANYKNRKTKFASLSSLNVEIQATVKKLELISIEYDVN